jgi:hypothetical protein
MFVTLPDTPMPPTYQSDDCRFVFRSVQAGESCSLVGIGSVGKSNLLQHLTRADVQAHHLSKAEAAHLLTVYLDPHTLVHLRGRALDEAGDLWPGYELLLSRLHRTLLHTDAARNKKKGESLVEQIAPIVDRVRSTDSVTRQSGLRHVEDALYTVLADDDRWRVAFLLDEISDFGALPALFFQSLRGLRDQYKGRVTYITTSRTPLDALLNDLSGESRAAMKEFTELFRDHTRYISPLDAASAAAVVDRFIDRYEASYERLETAAKFLKGDVFALTGGHVGLLRRSFRPAVQYLIDDETGHLSDYLLAASGVAGECETIIASLTDDERRVFYHAIQDGQIQDMAVWRGLFEKHIVKESTRGTAEFRLPLLGDYALRHPDMLVGRVNRR